MKTKDEQIALALEALERAEKALSEAMMVAPVTHLPPSAPAAIQVTQTAIAALKQAQQAQEPVTQDEIMEAHALALTAHCATNGFDSAVYATEHGSQGYAVSVETAERFNARNQPAPKQAEPAWQPIESAPNGTMVLFANMSPRIQASEWCFVAWMADGKLCGHRMDKPTHWMQLPKPPEAS